MAAGRSIFSWAVERLVEIPDAAGHSDFADPGFDPALLTLNPTRQMQVRVSYRLGGLGVELVYH